MASAATTTSTSLLLLFLLVAAPARAELDVPALLYKGREAGKSTPLTLLPDPLPASLVERLKGTGAEKAPVFAQLSPPLQRALLWDVGLVLATDGSRYVQVKTKCGKTMGDIFLHKDTVSQVANCSVAVCNGQILTYAYPNCSADAIVSETRCAVTDSDPGLTSVTVLHNSTAWSEEGSVENSYNFTMFKYDTSASPTIATSELYTIYQSPDRALRDRQSCPNKATAFVVPCRVISEKNVTAAADWCTPYSGYVVDLWVAEEVNSALRAADHSKWVQTSTIFIALFGLACLVSFSFAYLMWRNRTLKAAPTPTHYAVLNNNGNTFIGTPGTVVAGNSSGEPPSRSSQLLAIDRLNEEYLAKSRELVEFVDDEELLVRKIDYDALKFDKLIAKGANGEVWCGEYAGQFVAVKRLLTDIRSDVRAIEIFSREIRLGSSLEHPNIVRFIGLSWRSLAELSMVSEFLPMGDLARFLVSNESHALTWKHEKLSLASDIAKALVYLHSLVPVIIHRDLKSLNVLLTATFEAKLSDFGLSRERSFEETMTMGVGTLLWTAPEVLRGDRYSEKADIYSYGIVLSELDTCLPPYSLNDEVGRLRSKNMELLPLIRNGKIAPQFRPDCPPAVLTLAQACLNQDPERRPNAMQIVYMLQSKVSMSL